MFRSHVQAQGITKILCACRAYSDSQNQLQLKIQQFILRIAV
jgi:hypothetical protein